MLAVLILLTPSRRTNFIDCKKAQVRITVLLIMDVKTHWSSTLALLEGVYLLQEFTCKSLQNPKYGDYRPLYTTQVNHQEKIFPSGRNGSVRVGALHQSHQRHHGGRLLCAQPRYHASHCISPSDRCFTVSSRSVGLLF